MRRLGAERRWQLMLIHKQRDNMVISAAFPL
jgi:hypothetical protein